MNNFFRKFRDQSRDVLARDLAALGIHIHLADRGRKEEKIRAGFRWLGSVSLGVIDIDGGPVTWINVVRIKRRDRNSGPMYRVVFGIPNDKLPENHHPLKLTTVRKKTFPVFGKVTDVDWNGSAVLLPLITTFSNDSAVDQFVTEVGNLQVRTHPPQFQGFTIEVDRKFRPNLQHWAAIQKIAEYLLATTRDL